MHLHAQVKMRVRGLYDAQQTARDPIIPFVEFSLPSLGIPMPTRDSQGFFWNSYGFLRNLVGIPVEVHGDS